VCSDGTQNYIAREVVYEGLGVVVRPLWAVDNEGDEGLGGLEVVTDDGYDHSEERIRIGYSIERGEEEYDGWGIGSDKIVDCNYRYLCSAETGEEKHGEVIRRKQF
jgi:hypothetical protein